MVTSPFNLMFSTAGLFYAFLLPIVAVQFFSLLVLPLTMKPGLRTIDMGHALFSYTSQAMGIVLMSIGGVPTLYSVLASQPLSSSTYTALLLIFAVGGVTYLWHDAALGNIDAAAKALPKMIFGCAWKFIGLVVVVMSFLSLILRVVLEGPAPSESWWIMHLVLVFYGVLLTFTSIAGKSSGGFHSQTVASHAKVAAKKKK